MQTGSAKGHSPCLMDLGDFRIIRAGPRHVADTFAEQ
jgi:hypothetical protein